MKFQYHEDGTLPKETHYVFVFGSNLAGIHGAGAAKVARDIFGRPNGTPTGPYLNQSLLAETWAIPTKDEGFNVIDLVGITFMVNVFLAHVIANPTKKYFVTRIGCGFAGYKDSQIAPMFKGFPPNCSFAEQWKPYLEENT